MPMPDFLAEPWLYDHEDEWPEATLFYLTSLQELWPIIHDAHLLSSCNLALSFIG